MLRRRLSPRWHRRTAGALPPHWASAPRRTTPDHVQIAREALLETPHSLLSSFWIQWALRVSFAEWVSRDRRVCVGHQKNQKSTIHTGIDVASASSAITQTDSQS